MKRIHLFEFEDLQWFPNWIRICLTRLIMVMHKKFKTSEDMAQLLSNLIEKTKTSTIIDLCSGSGGPMLDVHQLLRDKHNIKNIELTLSDLYPNLEAAKTINSKQNGINYRTTPLDATKLENDVVGLLTMVGSFHHMKPAMAKSILKEAKQKKQPICIMEINKKFPVVLWWLFIPLSTILCLFITPLVKPLTLKQIIFTYLIPIIPICFAWDAVITSGRIYRLDDLNLLLKGLDNDENYTWEKGIINKKTEKVYLIGYPTINGYA
ncbi:class I SAM-dependent methyltransferase [Pontimicrobium sp. SW4]|uniref:Class I SAM-dependent methyltransferase n=1 Tax=Pontimicrobium sp. SW4 TaxID=3153519 RepID=A0AAU7BRG9_9FLAO